jgi:hypothetical protein
MGSAEKGKIESKLNLGDEIRGFAKDQYQQVMASGPWSIPGGEVGKGIGGVVSAAKAGLSHLIPKSAGEAAEKVAGAVVGKEAGQAADEIGSSRSLVPRRSSAPPSKSYQHLGRATPVKKVLPSKGRALGGSGKAPSVGSGETSESLSSSKGMKNVTGTGRKSLPSSKHGDYDAELGKQTSRSKIPGGKKGAVKGSRKKKTTVV